MASSPDSPRAGRCRWTPGLPRPKPSWQKWRSSSIGIGKPPTRRFSARSPSARATSSRASAMHISSPLADRWSEGSRNCKRHRRWIWYSDNTDLELVPMLQDAGRFSEAESIVMAVRGRAPNDRKVHVQLGLDLRRHRPVRPGRRGVSAGCRSLDGKRLRRGGSGEGSRRSRTDPGGARRSSTAWSCAPDPRRFPPELFSLVYTRLGRVDEAFGVPGARGCSEVATHLVVEGGSPVGPLARRPSLRRPPGTAGTLADLGDNSVSMVKEKLNGESRNRHRQEQA